MWFGPPCCFLVILSNLEAILICNLLTNGVAFLTHGTPGLVKKKLKKNTQKMLKNAKCIAKYSLSQHSLIFS